MLNYVIYDRMYYTAIRGIKTVGKKFPYFMFAK